MAAIAMQLGNELMQRINPRLQIVIGGLIYVSAIYCAQFAESFTVFLVIYSVLTGIGFGIVYFVPLLCAWSYFPAKKNLVSGFILCCASLNALFLVSVTKNIVNPENESPDIKI